MKTSRILRTFFLRGVFGAALLAAPAFAISPEELAALRAKAERGNAVAQYNLGMVYAAINDPTSDPIEAYVWLNLAADNGATGRALVILESQLTPEQESEGKRRLEIRRTEIAAHKAALARPTETPTPTVAPESPVTSATPTSAASPIMAAPPPVIAAAGSDNDVAALQAELGKMSTELGNAWKENEQLKASLAKLREAPKDDFSHQLNVANDKLKSAETELAQAIAAENELKDAKDTNDRLSAEVKKLTDENQQLHTLTAASPADSNQRAAAEKALAAAQSSLSALQAQLADAQAKAAANTDREKQLASTQTKLDAAVRSYELQQKQIDDLQKSLADAQSGRSQLEQQVADLKASASKSDVSAETQLKAVQDELATLTQQNQQLTKQLSDAKAQGSANSPEVTDLNAQLADVRNRLAASEQALAHTREEQSQNSKQELAQLQTELQNAQQRADAAETSAAKTAQERDTLKQELAAPKTAPNPSPELDNARAELSRVQQELTAANAERSSLSEHLAADEAKLATPTPAPAAETAAAPTEDVAALHKELDETQGKLDAALRTYRLQEDEVDRLQKALTNIDGERAQLADRIQTADTETAAAKAQAASNQDASAQLTAAREQIRQLQNQVASLATDNSELRNRSALPLPSTNSTVSTPLRPGTAAAQEISAEVAPAVPTPTPAPRTYTIADGDTLTRISRHFYGTSERWNEILEANRDVIHDPKNLTVGVTLKIP